MPLLAVGREVRRSVVELPAPAVEFKRGVVELTIVMLTVSNVCDVVFVSGGDHTNPATGLAVVIMFLARRALRKIAENILFGVEAASPERQIYRNADPFFILRTIDGDCSRKGRERIPRYGGAIGVDQSLSDEAVLKTSSFP